MKKIIIKQIGSAADREIRSDRRAIVIVERDGRIFESTPVSIERAAEMVEILK